MVYMNDAFCMAVGVCGIGVRCLIEVGMYVIKKYISAVLCERKVWEYCV